MNIHMHVYKKYIYNHINNLPYDIQREIWKYHQQYWKNINNIHVLPQLLEWHRKKANILRSRLAHRPRSPVITQMVVYGCPDYLLPDNNTINRKNSKPNKKVHARQNKFPKNQRPNIKQARRPKRH